MAANSGNSNAKHIIIIDHKHPFFYSLVAALKNEGYRVSVVDKEDVCEKVLHDDTIELVLVDEQMPKTELEELVHATRQTVIPSPVAVMSTWKDVEYVSDLLEKGSVEFVDKDVGPSIFLKQVRLILQQYEKNHMPDPNNPRPYRDRPKSKGVSRKDDPD